MTESVVEAFGRATSLPGGRLEPCPAGGLRWPAEIRGLLASRVPITDDEIRRQRPILDRLRTNLEILRGLGGGGVGCNPALLALFERARTLF